MTASAIATSSMTASPIAASCVTGQWVYEKDDHCENKNSAGNFLHIFPPCLILQMYFKSLYSTFQCVSMNNKQELHLKVDRMYAVISIQLDNKYPEKQSVIYFTSHYQYRPYSFL